jgi:hypothetical protein
MLFAILLLGVVGTCAELLLLAHTEGFWQQVPVYLLLGSLVVLGWHAVRRGTASMRVLQALMVLFVASGFVGLGQHFSGNMEFELEMHPTAEGFGLMWEALRGATPTLAPGTMIQLGLLGLLYAHRHPALGVVAPRSSDEDGGIR